VHLAEAERTKHNVSLVSAVSQLLMMRKKPFLSISGMARSADDKEKEVINCLKNLDCWSADLVCC
jgi:hypothetical protein